MCSIHYTSGPFMLKLINLSYMHIPISIGSDCSPAPVYKIRVSEIVVLHPSLFAFKNIKTKTKQNTEKL